MQYGAGPAFPDLEEDVPQELFPCELCGRSFTAKALQRHVGICGKVFQRKHKRQSRAYGSRKEWKRSLTIRSRRTILRQRVRRFESRSGTTGWCQTPRNRAKNLPRCLFRPRRVTIECRAHIVDASSTPMLLIGTFRSARLRKPDRTNQEQPGNDRRRRF